MLQRLEQVNTDLHGNWDIAEDEVDLDVLVHRVDALPTGPKVRGVASVEACRLRQIPPQNAEHSVVRTCVLPFSFLTDMSYLTLRSARTAYRSALESLTSAIVSLLTGKCVPPMTALIGEVIITSFLCSRFIK